MDETYELELAKEGERSCSYTEDQWIAWEEKLALAPDLAAKKALVYGPFGVTTPDFKYRAALCTLQELQELLDVESLEANAKADTLMMKEKQELLSSERELRGNSLWRKATRISHRRAVLELEIATRVGKPDTVIKDLSRAVAIVMGLTLSDPAPLNADVAVVTETPRKSVLDDDLISTDTLVVNMLQSVQFIEHQTPLLRSVRDNLRNLDVYARELMFAHVASDMSWATSATAKAKAMISGVFRKQSPSTTTTTNSASLKLSAEQRWWILELFLEDFAFEYTDVGGYLEVIIEDLKRKHDDAQRFGSRAAHEKLSLAQLNTLLAREPSLFRSDAAFAVRYLCLVRAAAKTEKDATELAVQDDSQRSAKIEAAEDNLTALAVFSVTANPLRAAIIHSQLRELQYREGKGFLKSKLFQYLQLPRFGADFVNPGHVRSARADELVVFSTPSYSHRYSSTQPTTSLRVDSVSVAIGDQRVSASDDLRLIKSVLYELWASGNFTDDDEKMLYKYLEKEFVDAEKAECMVVSGRGELSEWKDKLPRKGEELSEWSSKTEISFCEFNPSLFGPEDELEVFVHVRNVKMLTVQVYEVRTVDYYTRLRSEVQGDISLDGLLPNEEKQIDLSHLSPWQKSRVHVKLSPNATGRRGVFVVEVFEKDTTCRAILRKGFLRHVERVSAQGHEFTVLDERGSVLKKASLQLMNLRGGSSKAQPPRTYQPIDDSGVIVVPFRQPGESPSDKFGIVFQHDDFGYLLRPFKYTEATFTLTTEIYIDSEQLRPGEEATVLARPLLSVGSAPTHHVSLELLTDLKATITFVSANKETSAGTSQKVVQSIGSVLELMEGRCSFSIPLDTEAVTVEISARVKPTVSSSDTTDLRGLPVVRSAKAFVVQRVTQFEATFTPHFLRRPKPAATTESTASATTPRFDYYIAVLGHNGEPIRGKEMQISIQHLHFTNPITQNLHTDDNGEIRLGELAFVQEVSASFAGGYNGANSWTWELPNLRTYSPQMVNCSLDECIRIPVARAYSSYIQDWLAAGLITLCRAIDTQENQPVLEAVGDRVGLSCITNSHGEVVSITFSIAHAGEFVLYVRPLDVKFPLTVCKLRQEILVATTTPYNNILVQQKKILLATPTCPLTIVGFRLDESTAEQKTWLHVELDQAKPQTTQVWVVLKRFLDQTDAKLTSAVAAKSLSNGGGHYLLASLAFKSTVRESEFLKKRKISDEYTYILQRRAFLKANPHSLQLLGTSSLPKPTLLQTPHVVDESDMEELVMRDGERVTGFKSNPEEAESAAICGSFRGGGGGGWGCGPATSSISFLAGGSAAIACSAVDTRGIASLCLSDVPLFMEATTRDLELVILAFDAESGQVTSLESQINRSVNVHATAKRDVRLSPEEALENAVPSMQIQRHEVLQAGQSRTLPRTFSSKYALYETLGSAMDLWATLCSDGEIPDLVEQLKKWPVMKLKEKTAFYQKNACDDLNFFLYRKDRKFFETHAKPFVSAKLSKSLVDFFVLEDGNSLLQRYAHPGVFQKLSVIEKLLVAERAETPEQKKAMCQHVIDVIDGASAADSAIGHQLSRIFDTVLSQGAVKPDAALEELQEYAFAESNASLPPPPPAPMTGGMRFGMAAPSAAPMRSRMLSAARGSSQAFGAASLDTAAFGATAFGSAPSALMQCERASAMPMRKMKKMAVRASQSSDEEDEEEKESFAHEDGADDDDFGVQSLDSDDDSSCDDEQGNETELDDGDGDNEPDKTERKREITKRRAKPYLLPGKVRRVQEKRFFTTQKPHLDGRNMFWKDYATHLMMKTTMTTVDQQATREEENRSNRFLSSFFPEALRSFTEGMLALSVLDLAPASDVTPASVRLLAGGARVQLDAMADVVLYHQGIGSGSVSNEPNSALILKQRLVSQADRASASSTDFVDIRPAREFIVNRIYSCVVSVSNIGSKRLKNVNLLTQIPRGSIPLTSSGFYTKNQVIEIAPHDTNTYSFDFYFPETGQFTQYPAHASLDGQVVAWASTDEQYTKPLTVVLKATAVDLTSWSDVAARGSLEDVLVFLKNEPAIAKLGLDALAWRCQEPAFYSGLVKYLRQRWVFVESIWKYAFLYMDVAGIQELISAKNDFARALGHGISTSIIQLNRSLYHQERFDASFSFDHTEFGPLLSRRVHRVSGKTASSSPGLFGYSTSSSSSSEVAAATSDNEPARVLHRKAREYYRTLCQTLSLRATLTVDQLLVVTYFLILFHRIGDALQVFERVKQLDACAMRDTTEVSIAADYMDAYLDFFRRDANAAVGPRTFPIARRNVAKYAKLANDRWRERFTRLEEVLDEHDELRAAALASAQQSLRKSQTSTTTVSGKPPSQRVPDDDEVRLTAEVKGDEVHFTSQNLGACEISFYRIDVELMFSTEPFDSFSDSAASKSSLLLIKPWQQVRVELVENDSTSTMTTVVWKMPTELAASPMLLRIRELEATRSVTTIAAPIDLTRSYFNSQLQVIVTKQAGFLQVLHNGLPVPSCYVKVYAKAAAAGSAGSKKAQFYKDGYTDVIGKFDYAAINGDLLTRVEKFSILVSHPTLGTVVQQVAPPVLAVTSSEFKDREAREAMWF